MSADFGPGDFVEALVANRFYRGLQPVEKRAVHQVLAVFDLPGTTRCGACGQHCRTAFLIVVSLEHGAMGRCLCGWRPVYRPKAGLIEGLKRPVELPETVDA